MVPAVRQLLVVGAGFAGAVYARELAERGWSVTLIDKRPHVAGNAYDEIHSGTRIHRYGPHLFHTNSGHLVRWIARFGALVPYEHRVSAMLPDGRFVPFPINRVTINRVFGTRLHKPEDVKLFLARQTVPIPNPQNAADYLLSTIGRILTDLFFRPYALKMWGLSLEDLDISIVKRVTTGWDDDDRYFKSDRFQVLPKHGYTNLVSRILKHPRICVCLNQPFEQVMLRDYFHCFNSMPIDEYYSFCFDPLPYRSIRFHNQGVSWEDVLPNAVTNYPTDKQFTRRTDWCRLPHHVVSREDTTTITLEEPCDYRDNHMERYYPIRTSDHRFEKRYHKYRALSKRDGATTFIGRCGTYQYLDMHQVINQSIVGAIAWAKRHE